MKLLDVPPREPKDEFHLQTRQASMRSLVITEENNENSSSSKLSSDSYGGESESISVMARSEIFDLAKELIDERLKADAVDRLRMLDEKVKELQKSLEASLENTLKRETEKLQNAVSKLDEQLEFVRI